MARINNQEVMQKLIDELKLYPGRDLIPSELADKILATYQVNSQDVNVSVVSNPTVYRDTGAGNDKTFTVPSGKKWKILHLANKYEATATVGNRSWRFKIYDETGEIMVFYQASSVITASQNRWISFVPGAWVSTTELEIDPGYAGAEIFPLSEELILLEGWSIEFKDEDNADASDVMKMTLEVDESDL